MKKTLSTMRKSLCPACLMLLTLLTPCAAEQTMEAETVFAALTLNIIRFTNWPGTATQHFKDGINLCVYGDNVTLDAFTSIDQKPVGEFKIKIINLAHLNNFERCDALFLSELRQNLLLQVFSETRHRNILTIGENQNFAEQGGMIGLRNINNKISLDMNLKTIRESEINISSRLLTLANIIEK